MSEFFDIKDARNRFDQLRNIFDPNQIGRRVAFLIAYELRIESISTPQDLHALPKNVRVALGNNVARYLSTNAENYEDFRGLAIMTWEETEKILQRTQK